MRETVKPDDVVIATNLHNAGSFKFLWAIVGLMIFAQLLSLVLVCGILSFLRRHSSLFSKSTYKLHVQFTVLLAVQVGFEI